MSNIKPDDFRKHAAEEDFFRLAAMEIESEQNEEFLEAQSLPDPSPEVMTRMQVNLQMAIRRAHTRKRRQTIFLHLGRFTACAAVICCVLMSGVYFSVDAARNSINNFVLELFDDHAAVNTIVSETTEGTTLPMNWNGPFYITWVPARFTSVRSEQIDSFWILVYASQNNLDNLSIYVWDVFHSPSIDIENMQLIEENSIQGTPAKIYTSKNKNSCMLIWTKADYVIEIGGTITPEEAEEIAKSFVI